MKVEFNYIFFSLLVFLANDLLVVSVDAGYDDFAARLEISTELILYSFIDDHNNTCSFGVIATPSRDTSVADLLKLYNGYLDRDKTNFLKFINDFKKLPDNQTLEAFKNSCSKYDGGYFDDIYSPMASISDNSMYQGISFQENGRLCTFSGIIKPPKDISFTQLSEFYINKLDEYRSNGANFINDFKKLPPDKQTTEKFKDLCRKNKGFFGHNFIWDSSLSGNIEKFIESLEVNVDKGNITGFGSPGCHLWWDLHKENDPDNNNIFDTGLLAALNYYNNELYDVVMQAENAEDFRNTTIEDALNSACKHWATGK